MKVKVTLVLVAVVSVVFLGLLASTIIAFGQLGTVRSDAEQLCRIAEAQIGTGLDICNKYD